MSQTNYLLPYSNSVNVLYNLYVMVGTCLTIRFWRTFSPNPTFPPPKIICLLQMTDFVTCCSLQIVPYPWYGNYWISLSSSCNIHSRCQGFCGQLCAMVYIESSHMVMQGKHLGHATHMSKHGWGLLKLWRLTIWPTAIWG